MEMAQSDTQIGCFSSLLNLFKRSGSQKHATVTLTPSAPEDIGAGKGSTNELPEYANFLSSYPCCAAPLPQTSGEKPPAYVERELEGQFRPDVIKTIEETVDKYDSELRALSLQIWKHPEIGFEEKFAHDVLTKFMEEHGYEVTPHYLGLSTAWRAVFSYKSSSAKMTKIPVIGINSEMDALPGVGHACGHNLIAIAGVGVALAVKAALEKHDVSGKIILLGTPAEEGGGGKIALMERGAYKEMDACVMCHPGPGELHTAGVGPSLASQPLDVEFFGHGAHAAWAPWEAQNALDAAFLAYSSVSVLRQQIKPTHRVHGIVSGRDWAPNIIPDYAKMRWIVRAPTWDEVEVLRKRVLACFEAAATATGCKVEISNGVGYYDLRQNTVLGAEFAHVMKSCCAVDVRADGGMSASTDFGNITYELPALHPSYAIPTKPNGANHTPQFTESAGTAEAHSATLAVTKGLAGATFRVLDDADFAAKVKKAWEDDMNSKPASV